MSRRILVVEDNPDHVDLLREAFGPTLAPDAIEVLDDGEAVIDYLERARAERPAVILLDLNLPRKDGFRVLEEIREHPELRYIPVVVVSTSQSERDVRRAYERQANAFITKPVSFEQYRRMATAIRSFWLDVVASN